MSDIKTPKPQGPYKVGTKVFTVIDESRTETVGPHKNEEKRKLTCRIYYPASEDCINTCSKSELLSRAVTVGIGKEFKFKVDYDKITSEGKNASECFVDAPHIEGEKFPLLIFSHGFKSYKEGNSYLLTEISSHGYVVISIGHTYESLAETHEDGMVTYFDKSLTSKTVKPLIPGAIALMRLASFKGTPEEQYEEFTKAQNKYCRFNVERVKEWGKDTSFILEYARDAFSNFIDFTPGVGISGHSLGGATAYYMCQTNENFVCGINIDGGLFGDYDGMTMTRPFCHICSEANYNVASRVKFGKSADSYYVTFRKIKHIAFADIKYFLKLPMMTGKIPADIAHNNICSCHLKFLDKYLKNKDIEMEIPDSEYIRFEKY